MSSARAKKKRIEKELRDRIKGSFETHKNSSNENVNRTIKISFLRFCIYQFILGADCNL